MEERKRLWVKGEALRQEGRCRIVGRGRVLEAATCLLLPGTPVILATAVMDREAGSVGYPFHENTWNKADPWPKISLCAGDIHLGNNCFRVHLFSWLQVARLPETKTSWGFCDYCRPISIPQWLDYDHRSGDKYGIFHC